MASAIDDSPSSSSESIINMTDIRIIANPPTILSIQTFESFSSKIFVNVPVVIQTTLLHATRAQLSWFVDDELIVPTDNDDNDNNSHSFIPQFRHIGKTLTVVIRPYREGYHGNNKCFQEAYQFENVIEDMPYMPIVTELREEFTQCKRSHEEKKNVLRMMTYNILADLYVSREVEGGTNAVTYPHVKQEHLLKTRRMPMILAEILAHDADVVCLQEVDGAVFDTYLEPAFQAMGYDGYYSNKASCQREGCAMFWIREKFEVEDALMFGVRDLFHADEDTDEGGADQDRDTNYDGSQNEWKSMKGINRLFNSHEELRKVTMEKIGQVVQIATLKVKSPNNKEEKQQPKRMVVANTHLFYHPMADHIRAMQVYVVCKEIDEIRRRRRSWDDGTNHNSYPPPHPCPFMLCGDLNSDPLSGVAQLLFARLVQPGHPDCWKYLHEYQWDMDTSASEHDEQHVVNSGDKHEEEETAFKDAKTKQPPPVAVVAPDIELPDSFPELVSGCLEMPKFTNFAVDFVDTLDYIIGSQASSSNNSVGCGEVYGFIPKRSARMPLASEVERYVAMPNEFMPSDHVSVVCDFTWCKNNNDP